MTSLTAKWSVFYFEKPGLKMLERSLLKLINTYNIQPNTYKKIISITLVSSRWYVIMNNIFFLNISLYKFHAKKFFIQTNIRVTAQ